MAAKVLILGGSGLLAMELSVFLKKYYQVIALPKEDLDVTTLPSIKESLLRYKPDIVINTAAFMNADRCELRPDLAFLVNSLGARNVASACEQYGILHIWFSTDFVFDGEKNDLYTEFDQVNPLNTYGVSKAAGEKEIINNSDNYLIIRTSGLFGRSKANFLTKMLDKVKNNEEISIVDDIFMSPCYTQHLAKGLFDLIEKEHLRGIYHIANTGFTSWYGLFEEMLKQHGIEYPVNPIRFSERQNPVKLAKRPLKTPLSIEKFEMDVGRLPDWKIGISEFLEDANRKTKVLF